MNLIIGVMTAMSSNELQIGRPCYEELTYFDM